MSKTERLWRWNVTKTNKEHAMSNYYMEAPVDQPAIHGLFEKPDGTELDPSEEKLIADEINDACEIAARQGHAIWMNTGRDRVIARANGVPLQVGSVAVRWVPLAEGAFFPHIPHDNKAA